MQCVPMQCVPVFASCSLAAEQRNELWLTSLSYLLLIVCVCV